jgi:hypothetical protein
MGSEARMAADPVFGVRAVGSYEQLPGCPDHAVSALEPAALDRLCRGECYHPSDRRRLIERIEVVKIRPQRDASEAVGALIEDPWRVFACEPDAAGCRVRFDDPDFVREGRDALYYVRAIEAPSRALNADPVACAGVPDEEDCFAEVRERAWSSPIFVDFQHTEIAGLR